MDDDNVARIGVSLPPKLLSKFDSLIEGMGYANRSEAIRDAVREYIRKSELSGERGLRAGIISIIYDHDVRGVNDVLVELQHKYHHVIQMTTHMHLDEHNCMEIIIVRGEAAKIKEVRDRLASVRGVTHSDLLLATAVEHSH
jgi:CopG family nickel-responsive transcriptional regulator